MRFARLLVLSSLLAGTAACVDDPTASTASPEPGDAPRLSRSAVPVRVDTFDTDPNDGDHTQAFQDAIAASSVVYVPAGTYNVNGSIPVPSNTRIYGDSGQSRIVQRVYRAPIFRLQGNATSFVEDVTIERLVFRATNHYTFGVWGSGVRDITVQKNVAENASLVRFEAYRLPIQTAADLNRNLRVLENRGTGTWAPGQPSDGDSISPTIRVAFTDTATVSGNVLSGYPHGIQWWGFSKYTGGTVDEQMPLMDWDDAKEVRNVYISDNVVSNVSGGIWGSMGEHVEVRRNTVSECNDVCLDAESSINVLFTENTAWNAGSGVLGVFYFSKDVVFNWNNIWQDGTRGRTLFYMKNKSQISTDITATLANNTFRYTGATGVGRLIKNASEGLYVNNNTLDNTVIDFSLNANNYGGVQIRGNTLTFDRSTGTQPAIWVAKNNGSNGESVSVNGSYEVEIAGNDISSSYSQSQAGIQVEENIGWIDESGTHHVSDIRVDTWIHQNEIRDFSPSIKYDRDHVNRSFLIEYNKYTTSITGPTGTNVTRRYNTLLSTTPPPGGGCTDPSDIFCSDF